MALQELTPELALACYLRWRAQKDQERREIAVGLGSCGLANRMAVGEEPEFREYAERYLGPALLNVLKVVGDAPGAREAAITSFLLTVLQQGMEMGLMADTEGGVQ